MSAQGLLRDIVIMLGGGCVCWPADGLGDYLGLLLMLSAATPRVGAYSQLIGAKSQTIRTADHHIWWGENC